MAEMRYARFYEEIGIDDVPHEVVYGAPLPEGVSVRDTMRPGVIVCPRDATLPTIAAMMLTHGIHAVIVSSLQSGTPLVITDLDLVRAVLERSEDTRAGELAREPIATVPADAALSEAVELMAIRYATHVLATDPASGAPAGIVSTLDVAAVVGGSEPRLARLLRPAPARPASSARTPSEATVRATMHPGIITCAPDIALTGVARIMADYRVHCVAVAGVDTTSGNGQHLTWGLISDVDLVLAVHGGALAASATTIAATAPLAVREDESLDRAAALMAEHGTSHVVAVGAAGLPSGMISTLDVVRIVAGGDSSAQ